MSLINQMLRDLDARRATTPDAGELFDGIRPAPPAPAGPRAGLWLLVALLPLLGAALAWWWLGAPLPWEPTRKAPLTASAPALSRPAPARPAAAPGTVQPPHATPVPPQKKRASRPSTAAATPAPATPTKPRTAPGRPLPAASNHPAAGKPAAPRQEKPKTTPPSREGSPSRQRPPASSAASSGTPSIRVKPRPLSPREKAGALRRQARELLARGNAAGAEKRWRQAIRLQPGDPRAYLGLTAQLVREGRKSDALALLQRGLEATGSPAIRLLAARLLVEQGHTGQALALLPDDALAGEADLLGLKAALLQQRKEYRQARRLYVKALALRPGHAPWWLGLGISLEGEGDTSRALEAYRQALLRPGLDDASRKFVSTRIRILERRHP